MKLLRLVAMLLAAAWAGEASTAPLEVYGRLPAIEDIAISPSGKLIAVIATDGENRNVLIRAVSDKAIGPIVGGVRAGPVKLRGLQWAGEDNLLIISSTAGHLMDVIGPAREFYGGTIYNLATSKQTPIMRRMRNAYGALTGWPEIRVINGKPQVYVSSMTLFGTYVMPATYRIDPQTGDGEMVSVGSIAASDTLVSATGKSLAELRYEKENDAYALFVRKADDWVRAPTPADVDGYPSIMGLGRDGNSVLIAYEDKDERDFWAEVDLTTGKWGDPMSLAASQTALFDPSTHNFEGYRTLVGETETHTFFDPAKQAIWAAISKAYPGERISLLSLSDDRKRIVIKTDSPKAGVGFAMVDLNTGNSVWLGDEYAGLTTADVFPVKAITYKAADGVQITGYLTLPTGREAKNLPLVVLPHGGPAARDEPGYDWWSQGLASRGYAVLRPNFRGSDGFGWDFVEAGFGEWGKKMQTDLSDGVRHLAAEGVVDPARVCIVGASYGGYAALAGATLDRGVYRCAASIAGPSDLRRFVTSAKRRNGKGSERWWSEFMGVKDGRDKDLTAISPVAFVDKVEIPILLIHGRDDTVVLYDQSKVMADALRRAGKTYELVDLKGEDHFLSRGETRFQMLKSVVDFLEKHNPPR